MIGKIKLYKLYIITVFFTFFCYAPFLNCVYVQAADINNNIEKVTLPSSINSIGDSAFSQCKKLTTIFMPKRMQYLGNNVFEGCESLESIDIPEGVSRIGYDFAANCYSLNSVNIPSSVNKLSPGAFSGCLNLKVIEIPESVTTIQAPFQDLKQLTIIGEKGSAAEKHAKAIGLDFKEYGTEANVSENIYNDFQYSENSTQVEITKYLGR
ncbi:MAG: leucine-rich repeat domain-containing protein [Clostridiales bacterium]|nr:leucine-rich repeat domain-containing protein [Clostridiales bacterium]